MPLEVLGRLWPLGTARVTLASFRRNGAELQSAYRQVGPEVGRELVHEFADAATKHDGGLHGHTTHGKGGK